MLCCGAEEVYRLQSVPLSRSPAQDGTRGTHGVFPRIQMAGSTSELKSEGRLVQVQWASFWSGSGRQDWLQLLEENASLA